jgi:tRNA 2-thiouridine synthesizing protein A
MTRINACLVNIQDLSSPEGQGGILADQAMDPSSTLMSKVVPHKHIDARGQQCPMPLLMAKRGLRELESGMVLELIATDPGSERDFRSLERLGGHRVETEVSDDGIYCHRITKA